MELVKFCILAKHETPQFASRFLSPLSVNRFQKQTKVLARLWDLYYYLPYFPSLISRQVANHSL